MKLNYWEEIMKKLLIFTMITVAAFAAACGSSTEDHSGHDHGNMANTNAAPSGPLTLTETEGPQRIKDMMAARGEQDAAAPMVRVTAPVDGSTVESSTVRVQLVVGGDLKG